MGKRSKFLSLLALAASAVALGACSGGPSDEVSAVEEIIAQAEGLSFDDLCLKAIEESKGKTYYGVGNSSRGKKALPKFIAYLQTLDSAYTMNFEWQQPKNNKIFDQLTTDSKKETGTFASVLIQDGNQIQSKMVNTGILDTYIPKEWAAANSTTANEYEGFLPLQTLNKVFMFNNVDTNKVYDNCWDFVDEGEHGLYMDIDSEVVGKNFLYMLTKDTYATYLKNAFDAISDATQKAYFQTAIDSVAQDAIDLGLSENGKYALGWIKLWVNNYLEQTDDGPICNTLTASSSVDQFGLLVYSKLRSIEETALTSVNNVTVAAYQRGEDMYNQVNYSGIGGFGYCHYLFVPDNSPLPWTACAFNAYMTIVNENATDLNNNGTNDDEKVDGFSAWGADMGGYSSNPEVANMTEKVYKHKTGGYVGEVNTYDCKNDRLYDWWVGTGELVLEDPAYCASVAYTVGSWIEILDHYSAA